MSSLCHHVSWPAIRTNLQPSTMQDHSCWKVLKSEPAFMQILFEQVMGFLAQNIERSFDQNTRITMQISFIKELSSAKGILDAYNRKDTQEFQELTAAMQDRTGLNADEQVACYKTVMRYTILALSKFPTQWKLDEVNGPGRFRDLCAEAVVQLRLNWGSVIVEPKFNPTSEDFEFLNKSILKTPHTLDCAGYAFLKVREELACAWIIKLGNERGHTEYVRFFKQPFELLQEWNYRAVNNPNAGDLVLYFNNGVVKHAGVFNENGKVTSKLGIGEPGITEHEIHHVPAQFGREIMFFRKDIPESL